MTMINDPITSIKNHVLKIWETKDYANRQALSNFEWIATLMYVLMAVMIIHIIIYVMLHDLIVLADFYSGYKHWYITALQDAWKNSLWIQVGILYFMLCPKFTKYGIVLRRKWLDKDKQFFEWGESKLKQRFPKYKTVAEKRRERAENPPKRTRLQKWFRRRTQVERRLIRLGIWIGYGIVMGVFIITMISPFFGWWLLTGEEIETDKPTTEELKEEIELLKDKFPPTKPDNRPPSTIFDIFINNPDTVIP